MVPFRNVTFRIEYGLKPSSAMQEAFPSASMIPPTKNWFQVFQ